MNAIIASVRRVVVAVALLLTVVGLGAPALAKRPPDIFTGIVRHVSAENIKVYDPVQKKTLGFAVTPKFKNVFGGKDNTTYQMNAIKAGQYVKVYYDRHFFGLPHADRIYLLAQNNRKLSHQ